MKCLGDVEVKRSVTNNQGIVIRYSIGEKNIPCYFDDKYVKPQFISGDFRRLF